MDSIMLNSSSATALNVAANTHQEPYSHHNKSDRPESSRGRGRSSIRGRGRGLGRSTSGRGRGPPPSHNPSPQWTIGWVPVPNTGPSLHQSGPRQWTSPQWPSPQTQQWVNSQAAPWTAPPCPYPSVQTPRPKTASNFAGILGAAPTPSQVNSETAYQPTDIEQALYTMSLNPPDNNWYMDTGATSHMTNGAGNLSSYSKNQSFNRITVGNGFQIPILDSGHTTLPPPYPPLQLKYVLHSPSLIKNLLSVRQLTTDNNISIEFDPFGFLVKDYQTRIPILRCDSTGPLYPLSSSAAFTTSVSTFAALSQDRWHHRLGHPGPSILSSLKNNKFIHCGSSSSLKFCQSCVLGKQVKQPFVSSLNITFMPFDIIHSDLWTSPVLSNGGHHYYILFLDDFSNLLWTYPLTHKSQVFPIFKQCSIHLKTQFERDIKCFQCDNGTEYANTNFNNYCIQNGMTFRFSCPHTSPQNGKAERKIRSINNIIRTLLAHSSVPPSFWHHALQMATYIHNILPNKTKSYSTPTSILYQSQPTYQHLRVFGCLCFPLTPSSTIHKLENRSSPCVFLGYPSNHRGYKCYNLSSRKIVISRHVVFNEDVFPFSSQPQTPQTYQFLSSDPHPFF
ncbi:hypothetical protein E3N88_18285 [Mikania micrantha]|uniref:Integrase catalytic domain-containing protein n=1 Tax=Mikania micrantha TaxID=192012 RepID=A0A5N6NVM9_9ASTR|nr:hypothetical protein E3N88_18285 [Mikania micrantha]